MSAPLTAVRPMSAVVAEDVAQLAQALAEESRLLVELADVLRDQREGIVNGDLERIDRSVFASHRVMGTLREAQQRRTTILEILSGSSTTRLDELEEVLRDAMTEQLHLLRAELDRNARALAREIRINRELLGGAMQHGHRMIHALRAASTEPPAGHLATPLQGGSGPDAGAFIDRCV